MRNCSVAFRFKNIKTINTTGQTISPVTGGLGHYLFNSAHGLFLGFSPN
jgi:hypothetical protein